jgi:dipeptidyl aminopeptidase/acylaminoacyl peptidase
LKVVNSKKYLLFTMGEIALVIKFVMQHIRILWKTSRSSTFATIVILILLSTSVKTSSQIEAHWMRDGNSFWYTEGSSGNTFVYKVDALTGKKYLLFDHKKIRQSLEPFLKQKIQDQGVPFDHFSFTDEQENKVIFSVARRKFEIDLHTYNITELDTLQVKPNPHTIPRIIKQWRWSWPDIIEPRSPDGQWFLGLENHNLLIRSSIDGKSIELTSDGTKEREWLFGWEYGVGSSLWSPDGSSLVMARANLENVPIEWIPFFLGSTGVGEDLKVSRSGDPLPHLTLYIFNLVTKKGVEIKLEDTNKDKKFRVVGWTPDGSELWFEQTARSSSDGQPTKWKQIVAADPITGHTRVILTEYDRAQFISFLNNGKQFIMLSERSGWHHLYLYDTEGNLVRQLTKGNFPVLSGAHAWRSEQPIVEIDEESGWLYLRAQGNKDRPYDVHLYRAGMEKDEFKQLTQGNGWHDIQFSPSKKFFVDTYSSVKHPPVVELRKADGQLVRTLSEGQIEDFGEHTDIVREEFKLKAADDSTDLYGVLFKPPGLDTCKKYPLIEWIYAGPWTTVVPRRYNDYSAIDAESLARLGAAVFILDGRGTPGRGRLFEDAVLGNMGKHEIPDHVAVLRQLAEMHSWIDLNRVGVYGGSWGGYFSIRAMLLAPEVYHVGVAVKPACDLANYYADYVEPYLGLPEANPASYDYGSNSRIAKNLEGKLLIIHGTGDAEAPFSGTMKLTNALMHADKQFDLIVVPDEGHYPLRGRHGMYLRKVIQNHFTKNLNLRK